ncbi:MAG: RluA family pseudouridine synthase [Syntrophorhabdaceae bacterium]
MPRSFVFVSGLNEVRLDIFLTEKLSLARTKIKEMIEGGHVLVNGKTVKPAFRLKFKMEITGEIPDEEPLKLEAEEIPLDILYEDEFFLAINKPAGMVVHPSFGHNTGTLVHAILGYLKSACSSGFPGSGERMQGTMPNDASVRPGVVHRLDKGTTGVILIARQLRVQELLSDLFKDRKVQKTYRAIIEGIPDKTSWTTQGNIGRHPVDRKKMAVLRGGGRDASTGFKVLENLHDFSYVEAYPKTGRTHQIRVHLNYSGYPIVGDEMYGRKAKKLAPRPLLHAYRIEFVHPVVMSPVIIEAPIPPDMTEFIEKHRGQGD